MVVTQEIPPTQWRRVLDDLSRLHEGADARLIVLDDDHGVQTHGRTFRLAGLTSDGSPGLESISAILAGSAHVTHIIDRPRSLHVERRWEPRTLISLGPPVVAGLATRALPKLDAGRARGCALVRQPSPSAKIPQEA